MKNKPTLLVAHPENIGKSQQTDARQNRHEMTTKQTIEKEGRRHNISYKKLAVKWLFKHSTSHQLLWCFDNI